MQKLSLLILSVLFGVTAVFAQAEGLRGGQNGMAAEADTVKQVGIHPWKKVSPVTPVESYWTVYLQGGINIFDGDFTSEKKHSFQAPTVGMGVTYYFNNSWSIGADYVFRRYGVNGTGKDDTADILLRGTSHQADAYITFDIFNFWRPQNRYKLFALHLIGGGGMGWFKNSLYYPNEWHKESDGVTITLPERWNYHTAQQQSMSDSKYTRRAVFLGGASFEFNVNRSLALGVRAIYNYYIKDDIDGRVRGNNNDGVLDASVLLRYKIDAVNKSHVANFRSEKALDRVVAETNPYRGRGRDTVIIEYHSDTVIIREPSVKMTFDERMFYVYFDPNEYTLYDQSLKTIQQVADRLKNDENLCLEIIGYCDNTGPDEYNRALGRNRARSVADEFIHEYGIDSTRIKQVGMGIIRGRRSTAAYSPNRRAVIRLMTLEEYEKEQQSKHPKNQTMPEMKKITVGKHTNLHKIARDYYGNANCWIFIYEANLGTIKNPEKVNEGIEIMLPALSDAQIMINRETAAEMYKKYKN